MIHDEKQWYILYINYETKKYPDIHKIKILYLFVNKEKLRVH